MLIKSQLFAVDLALIAEDTDIIFSKSHFSKQTLGVYIRWCCLCNAITLAWSLVRRVGFVSVLTIKGFYSFHPCFFTLLWS